MSYAFTIPYLVLACIEFDLVQGERFGNFEVYQPMVFTLANKSILHDSFIHADAWCGDYVIRAEDAFHIRNIAIEGARLQ